MPDAEPTVATAGFVLIQVPPRLASFSVENCPVQTAALPVIGATRLTTLNAMVELQPVIPVKLMVVVPVVMPVTMPDVPIVATDGLLLLQVPTTVVSVRVTVEPAQTPLGPTIGPGAAEIDSVTDGDITLLQPVAQSVATTL
jgi:hypothetical protein